MLNLLGAACLLAGGALAGWRQVRAARRADQTLAELIAALAALADAIRLERTPLPRLLDRLGRTGEAAPFFRAVLLAARTGRSLGPAWRAAADALPLTPGEQSALAAVGDRLQGDEQSVCQALLLAREELLRFQRERREGRGDRERQGMALWLSGAALVGILLL